MFKKTERRTGPIVTIVLYMAILMAKWLWGIDISNHSREHAVAVAKRCIFELWFSLGICIVSGVIQYFVGYQWFFALGAAIVCFWAFWVLADRTDSPLPSVNQKHFPLYCDKLFQILFSGGAAAGFTFGAISPPLSVFIGLPVLAFLMLIAGGRVSAWCITFIDPDSPCGR